MPESTLSRSEYLLARREAIPPGATGWRSACTRLSRWEYRDDTTGGTGVYNEPESFPKGVTSGERMHKASVQKLLGHASISTTADAYTDWDVEQLAESLPEAVQNDEVGIVPQ